MMRNNDIVERLVSTTNSGVPRQATGTVNGVQVTLRIHQPLSSQNIWEIKVSSEDTDMVESSTGLSPREAETRFQRLVAEYDLSVE